MDCCWILLFGLTLQSVLAIIEPDASKVQETDAPYIVYIQGQIYCGGSIITDDLILTAAHCVEIGRPLKIIAGSKSITNRNPYRQERKVLHTVSHENYTVTASGVQAFYDLALIQVNKPFELNEHVQTVKFGQVNYSQNAKVFGWGTTHESGKGRSVYLRQKTVSLIESNECQNLMSHLIIKGTKQDYEICTEKAVCKGDSGGPLIQTIDGEEHMIGVVSWTADDIYNCTKSPAVYENVDYFFEWILNAINKIRLNEFYDKKSY